MKKTKSIEKKEDKKHQISKNNSGAPLGAPELKDEKKRIFIYKYKKN